MAASDNQDIVPGMPADSEPPRPSRRRHLVRAASFVLWGLALALQGSRTIADSSLSNVVVLAGFAFLFLLVHLQLILVQWLGERRWRRMHSRMQGSTYVSEVHGLPNRNYVLSELRREMPRARSLQQPFVLVQISVDDIAAIRERRGNEFAQRSAAALADVLKRLSRKSDFLAHVGDTRFIVLLVDANREQAGTYLRRLPGSLSISDGHKMLDVTVTVRLHEYDMEALYATDVLREVEEAKPLRRREERRLDAIAA